MSTAATVPGPSAPLSAAERSPAPDTARGIALLGIALANSVAHISARELGPSFRPVDGTGADRVVDVVVGLLVDNRAFPMFTLLLAYGLAVTARRQEQRGAPWPRTRSLLLRRTLWLGAFGLAHLILLFESDILLVYGLLGLVLVLLLRRRERTLVVVGSLALLPYLAFNGVDGMPGALSGPPVPLVLDTQTFAGALAARALTAASYVLAAPLVALVFLTPAVLGVLLARRRVLERPAEHLRLLRRLALGGFALSLPGAVPLVLASVQVLPVEVAGGYALGIVHAGTGLAGGVAFAALVAWRVGVREQRAARADGRWVPAGAWRVSRAVGQRSLTCYLLQSIVMVPLLAPWGAGWGVGAGTAFVAAVGVGTYASSALVAVLLERAGRPGPAEALLRRLVYGRATPQAQEATAAPNSSPRRSSS
ncbi:DUF418 domain-containing protein [Kineococcus sp. T13]|uniref:DUF418 domain-containing protein n=1 Tax=Kineococcus vitellinus TaxID=2696565 RepID=UPI001412B97D|nr:DUF418 domain-containing protein [Kineococcus vitellinus]NAZ77837.1 DUF418 domain-containing protein [Kineococcus vitellinus]